METKMETKTMTNRVTSMGMDGMTEMWTGEVRHRGATASTWRGALRGVMRGAVRGSCIAAVLAVGGCNGETVGADTSGGASDGASDDASDGAGPDCSEIFATRAAIEDSLAAMDAEAEDVRARIYGMCRDVAVELGAADLPAPPESITKEDAVAMCETAEQVVSARVGDGEVSVMVSAYSSGLTVYDWTTRSTCEATCGERRAAIQGRWPRVLPEELVGTCEGLCEELRGHRGRGAGAVGAVRDAARAAVTARAPWKTPLTAPAGRLRRRVYGHLRRRVRGRGGPLRGDLSGDLWDAPRDARMRQPVGAGTRGLRRVCDVQDRLWCTELVRGGGVGLADASGRPRGRRRRPRAGLSDGAPVPAEPCCEPVGRRGAT